MFVILLAGLTSIPDELYEAADLDGAKPRQSFFFVTLPLLAPIVLIAVTFRFIDAAEALRHHLLAHAGRAGHRDLYVVVLPLPAGLRALPSGPGHRRRVDVHDHAHVHLLLARAAAAEAGGGLAVAVEPATRRRRVSATGSASSAAAGSGSGAVLRAVFILLYLGFLLAAALLGGGHVDQAAGGPARRPAGLVAADPTTDPLHDCAEQLQRVDGPQELADHRRRDDRARADDRDCGRVLDGALPTGGKHLAFWFLSQRLLPPDRGHHPGLPALQPLLGGVVRLPARRHETRPRSSSTPSSPSRSRSG